MLAAEAAERELTLERQQIQIDTLNGQLEAAQSVAEDFRKIGAATERQDLVWFLI